MREFTTTTGLTFRLITCFSCGVLFGVPRELDETLHRDKQTFSCPNGHGQHYTISFRGTIARLQTDLAEAITARDTAEREKAALVARVETGTCPHCRRHFANLQRHVATKHARKTAS